MIIEPQRSDSVDGEIRIEEYTIRNSSREKLLGVELDNHLKFDYPVKMICTETGKNTSVNVSVICHVLCYYYVLCV